jgi:hypothetical protein
MYSLPSRETPHALVGQNGAIPDGDGVTPLPMTLRQVNLLLSYWVAFRKIKCVPRSCIPAPDSFNVRVCRDDSELTITLYM